MKELILLVMLLPRAALADVAQRTYALVELKSAGAVAGGALSDEVAGGTVALDAKGAPARYLKRECVARIRDRLLEVRAYSTMFEYGYGGAYGDGGSFGRMFCLEYGEAVKYRRDSRFWNFDSKKFLDDFKGKVPSSLDRKDFAKYSIFPLEDDDSGLGAILDSDMGGRRALQKTSYDCGAKDLGKAGEIVCRDKNLAALDIKVAVLYDGLVAKYDYLARVMRDWSARRSATFFPAGLESLYRSMLSYLECVKEKGGPDGCDMEEF
jgi:hypothetical protein